ncbi:hypothetical protein BATDEDRAFT_90488 [Batrachochytrium dendrobatidis JAM81]|uniref:DH domain-containing protein n=3 Tax=Batrachochytrium dendrobatidis TaxID=109871 RepID=F4P838_BATDJ|nr:uncharacterized protein BATDEDRAFT_90488 [Batrachochytrium dendrobatidis JAM81]EGF78547.1 hypothetical protein BATDEDRAFT_90488 [Batrachochytrium dendrobatidis JAM81]|eukprot:XP_006680884.1 hypothetical protein BATDEDRAFT_90488 [Batrachochytrium dendrobatidis JAM81]
MNAAARVTAAKRIYSTYLSTNRATFPLRWTHFISGPPVEDVIQVITLALDSPSAAIFDDISYIAMQTLESIYSGTYTPVDYDMEPMSSQDSNHCMKFRKSAFYQAMRNDLRGTIHLTTVQHARAVERLVDLSNTLPLDPIIWDKIYTSLEGVYLDHESPISKSIQTARKNIGLLIAQSGSNRAWSTSSLKEEESPFSSTKMLRSGAQNTRTFDSSEASHTFLPARAGDSTMCEYCGLRLTFDRGTEDSGSAYRCETCGYICHKNCRSQVHVTCTRSSAAVDLDMGAEVHSEKIRLVSEKLAALEKEVDIEMKIRDGLEKITKAKHLSGLGGSNIAGSGNLSGGGTVGIGKSRLKKPTSIEQEVTSQLERNTKRLAALKHEIQKRHLQLQNLQSIVVATASSTHSDSISELSKTISCCDLSNQNGIVNASNNSISGGMRSLNASYNPQSTSRLAHTDEMHDGGLIRVLIQDPSTKTESKKAIYIGENQSTVEVIERILEKANLPGIPTEFELSYTRPDGGRVLVKDEDRPLQIEDVDFSVMFFKISHREEPIPRNLNNPLIKKQREILMEIYESEMNYSQDLKLIVQTFLKPFESSGMLDMPTLENIFSNIEEIVTIHESLGKSLKEVTNDTNFQANTIIKCFTDSVLQMKCYTIYCGNQHNARRTLGKLITDSAFAKLVQKCEANPKLHKLSLADMLVKPMHRITRYPLLFKRLLPNLGTDSREFIALSGLLIEIEAVIFLVNETIKMREATFRIHQLDEVLDFGVVSEKFKIAIEGRSLISEKLLLYFKKSSNIPVEITVFLFSDMLLLVKSKRPDHLMLMKAPIPLESVVILDKPDEIDKNLFQIIHLEEDTHLMQAFSSYDKNTWLQEAESTRSHFSAIHYDLESNYMRIQTERYRIMNLEKPTVNHETNISTQQELYDQANGLSLGVLAKIRRRGSDTSTKKKTILGEAEQLRNEDGQIKRQSSLLQIFRSRKQEESLDPTSSLELNECDLSASQWVHDRSRQLSSQSTNAINAYQTEQIRESIAASGRGFDTSYGNPGSAGMIQRNDNRILVRGSTTDMLVEKPECSTATTSPKISDSHGLSSSKGYLGRKTTTSKMITRIFRMSSPAVDKTQEKPSINGRSIHNFSNTNETNSVITLQATGSNVVPAVTNPDVRSLENFDIDSLLAEGIAPENLDSYHQQVKKKRDLMGVIGKMKRSLNPVSNSESPVPGQS